MPLSSSLTVEDAYVTGANPAPGRSIVYEYPVRSGTGWSVALASRSDGGIGINAYIAGGTGASGTVPVAIRDGSGSPITASTDGIRALPTSDEVVQNLLVHILKELQHIRLHLEIMTGEEFGPEDVER